MSKGEYEGVLSIVGLLGKTHPTVAIIQPLLDKHRHDEAYDGTDPQGEARGLREALALIKDAGGVMPNVQAHLERLDRRTTPKAVDVVQPVIQESPELAERDDSNSYED